MNKLNLITSASFISDCSFQTFKSIHSYTLVSPRFAYNLNMRKTLFIEKINRPRRDKIKIAIIGAGIGGCSTAFFLEDYFKNDENKEVQIEIFDKESRIGGDLPLFKHNGFDYDINLSYGNSFHSYLNHFSTISETSLNRNKERAALFDSDGILLEIESNSFKKIINYFLTNLNFKQIFKLFKLICEHLEYLRIFYFMQEEGQAYDNIENLLRNIDPNIFTVSQHNFQENLQTQSLDSADILNLTNLACLNTLGQRNTVNGLVGVYSLITLLNPIRFNMEKTSKNLLDKCKNVRLFLNRQVTKISYHNKNPQRKTIVTYQKNNHEITKSYDYVIVTFPLTKLIKEQNFTLDLFYRDFLDCEMFHMYQYLIDGDLIESLKLSREDLFNLHTIDSRFKFQSIRSIRPTNRQNKLIYGVFSTNENLSQEDFGAIFLSGFKLLSKMLVYSVPLYKKVRYSHTPFPKVILDEEEKRERIFYLNSFDWLVGSKETKCISARNIALLISKKEMCNKNQQLFSIKQKKPTKFLFNNFYETMRTLNHYFLFSLTLCTMELFFKTVQSFY